MSGVIPRISRVRDNAKRQRSFYGWLHSVADEDVIATKLAWLHGWRYEWERVAKRQAHSIKTLRRQLSEVSERYAEMRELAQEGWSYADDYYQHKWLPPDLLAKWFPDNRYLTPALPPQEEPPQ